MLIEKKKKGICLKGEKERERERNLVQGTMILSNIPTWLKLTISLDTSKKKESLDFFILTSSLRKIIWSW